MGTKENWKIELADNDSCKTNLPDFYDNEVHPLFPPRHSRVVVLQLNEAMPQIKQILAHDGFRGELDLFSKDRFKVPAPFLSSRLSRRCSWTCSNCC